MAKLRDVHTIAYYDDQGSIVRESCFGVGHLPGIKQMALYRCEDGFVSPIAFFKDPADAEWFRAVLHKRFG
jgi:hypothetical protein